MKFLVDANMAPRFASLLVQAGHDAVAVRDLGLAHASDDEILDRAIEEKRTIISHDTDFGTLLAFRKVGQPSFVLIRSSDSMTPDQQAALVLENLALIEDDLEGGAVAVFARDRLRIRRLPLRPELG